MDMWTQEPCQTGQYLLSYVRWQAAPGKVVCRSVGPCIWLQHIQDVLWLGVKMHQGGYHYHIEGLSEVDSIRTASYAWQASAAVFWRMSSEDVADDPKTILCRLPLEQTRDDFF